MMRAMPKYREEVVNVELAHGLASLGLEANAETVEGQGFPDVLIYLGGLKLVVEGRIQYQRTSLMEDAQRRIADGLADISMAVLYPPDLKIADSMAGLVSKIESASYSGAVFYYTARGIERQEFTNASLSQLAEAIRAAFRIRVQNEVVREHVRRVEEAIEAVVRDSAVTDLFSASEALVARLGKALGVGDQIPAE